jgi:hypothetical protein
MTREDIIRMAKEAKLPYEYDTGRTLYLKELERFAALVASDRRSNQSTGASIKLEVFEDRMYFDMFCVRPEGSSDFNDTIHFVRKIDALLAQKIIERWIEQEREACAQIVEANAKVCEGDDLLHRVMMSNAQAIRARGSQ